MGTAKSSNIEPLSTDIVPEFVKFVEKEGNYYFHEPLRNWILIVCRQIKLCTYMCQQKQRKYYWFWHCTPVLLMTLGSMYVLFVLNFAVLFAILRLHKSLWTSTFKKNLFAILLLLKSVDFKLSGFIETKINDTVT